MTAAAAVMAAVTAAAVFAVLYLYMKSKAMKKEITELKQSGKAKQNNCAGLSDFIKQEKDNAQQKAKVKSLISDGSLADALDAVNAAAGLQKQ